MAENPKSREHITAVCLSVSHSLGVNKLSAQFEIGKHAAVLLALNTGLHSLDMISDEDYKLLDRRYRRKLRDIIVQNQLKRENSHTPVLTLEQKKEEQALEGKDRMFKMTLDQWDTHQDSKWRLRVFAEAERFRDKLESARRILELQRQTNRDIISRGESDIVSHKK